MEIYIINILLIFVYAALFLYNRNLRNKKTFCILASLNWILLSGLRDFSIGADTLAYEYIFDRMVYRSWSSVLTEFFDIYFAGGQGKDPGYMIFEKFVQIFTTNYQVFLIIIAITFTIPLGIWIHKNSSEPAMSFLIYSVLFYAFFAITGLRQTIATALVVMVGYKFIKERRFWPFLIITLVAFTMHKTAICFFPFYFIANKKITKKYFTILLAIFPIFFVFKNQLMVLLGGVAGYEQYVEQFEGAGTWIFSAILLILLGVTIFKYKIMLKNNLLVTHYINALLIAFAFTPLTFVDPSAMRVVQYYSLFLMLLVPEIIRAFNKNERNIVYYVATASLLILFAKNEPQYLFFWQ